MTEEIIWSLVRQADADVNEAVRAFLCRVYVESAAGSLRGEPRLTALYGRQPSEPRQRGREGRGRGREPLAAFAFALSPSLPSPLNVSQCENTVRPAQLRVLACCCLTYSKLIIVSLVSWSDFIGWRAK